jgi:hypothetical protein
MLDNGCTPAKGIPSAQAQVLVRTRMPSTHVCFRLAVSSERPVTSEVMRADDVAIYLSLLLSESNAGATCIVANEPP